jgi:DnaK suppressor protein
MAVKGGKKVAKKTVKKVVKVKKATVKRPIAKAAGKASKKAAPKASAKKVVKKATPKAKVAPKVAAKAAPKKIVKAKPKKEVVKKSQPVKTVAKKAIVAKKPVKQPVKKSVSAPVAPVKPVVLKPAVVKKSVTAAKPVASKTIPIKKPIISSDYDAMEETAMMVETLPKKPTTLLGALEFTPYRSNDGEEYMNDHQRDHFRKILNAWKQQLMQDVDTTVGHLKEEAVFYADPVDRASQEEGFNLELRTRDRERRLIKKIEQSLDLLNTGEFGYCEDCGAEIGIRRLEARPTAVKCIDCKTFQEIREKQLGG